MNKGKHWKEHKSRAISLALKGKKKSEEHKKHLSQARLGRFIGKDNPFFGKHHAKEVNEKNRQAHLGKTYSEEINRKKGRPQSSESRKNHSERMMGKNNPNWQDGKSYEPYSLDWTETLRRSIRERDNYICQLCSQYGNTVHHIDYNKKNCCPENLINLCVNCNLKVNLNRNYWTNYFNKLVEVKQNYG